MPGSRPYAGLWGGNKKPPPMTLHQGRACLARGATLIRGRPAHLAGALAAQQSSRCWCQHTLARHVRHASQPTGDNPVWCALRGPINASHLVLAHTVPGSLVARPCVYLPHHRFGRALRLLGTVLVLIRLAISVLQLVTKAYELVCRFFDCWCLDSFMVLHKLMQSVLPQPLGKLVCLIVIA